MNTINTYRGRLLSVLFTLLFCLPAEFDRQNALQAAPIDQQQALDKARQFYNGRGQAAKAGRLRVAPRTTDVTVAAANDCFYVFNAGEHDGFVIISGDDRTVPVLGYCDSGSFSAGDMPSNMQAWLDRYARQIRSMKPGDEMSYSPARLSSYPAVSPLITAKWNQDSPYNDMCPVFFDESKYGHCVTGCVATAMAQIMYYHQYPSATTQQIPGYTCKTDRKDFLQTTTPSYITVPAVAATTFDWSNMLDSYDGTATDTQKRAVAKLMQAVGAAMEMDYACSEVGGSGASSFNIKKALTTYFGYDKSMKSVSRDDYTSAQWDGLIYSEISASRPVCYSGSSPGGGHEFVVDGYDGQGYFHVNWGWGGVHNGYFLLDILTPDDNSGIGAGEGGYNAFQDAVIGIRPDQGGTNPADDVLTTDSVAIKGYTTFTRSSSSANFTGVTVANSFWNRTGYTGTFDLGYALFDANGTMLSVSTLRSNYKSQHTRGFMCYRNALSMNIGAGLGNGKYRIAPVSRLSGTNEWRPCIGSRKEYILATISGNRMELSFPCDNFTATMTLTNQPETNGPADLKINITNNGAEYIGGLFIYSRAAEAEEGDYICNDHLELGAGESLTRTISVNYNEVGTYYVYLVLEDGTVIATEEITVAAQKTQELTCTYAVANTSGNTLKSSTMDVDVTIRNSGSNTYDNNVKVYLIKKRNDDSGIYDFVSQKVSRLTLSPGSTAKRSFSFPDLENGGIYFARLFYYSADDQKYSSNTNVYTVSYTPTPTEKPTAYAQVNNGTLTFYYDGYRSSRAGKTYDMNTGNRYPDWAVDSLSIRQAVIDASFKDYRPTTTARWFYQQRNLTSIQGLSNLNTSSVTSMMTMFYECNVLQSLDVSGFDTGNVTDMRWMFYGCSALKSLDVTKFNTAKARSMQSMFNQCASLTSLDVSSFDTGNVEYMGWMFYGCSSLKSLSLKNFNTSKVSDMQEMFSNCSLLTSLDLSTFDTGNVENMGYMFYECRALKSVNLKNFNTTRVASFRSMFYECASLASLDVSGFNTSSATDIGWMFYRCSALKSIDLSKFNTEKVTNMKSMFCYDSALTSLDLSSFNTANVTDMPWMFYDCQALSTIYASNSFSTANVTNSKYMFTNCTSLVGGQGTRYNENYVDHTYARLDGGTAAPGYFTAKGSDTPYAVLAGNTLTFYYDGKMGTRSGKTYSVEAAYKGSNTPAWQADSLSIRTVSFDASFAAYRPTSTAIWFSGYYNNLTAFTGMNNLNTSEVTNMDNMFSLCRSVTSLDVSNFNTSKVTNMQSMFYGCSSLTNLDVSGFDMRNVTIMRAMFYNCGELRSLDVSRWSTPKATDMEFMFYGCSKVPVLNVSGFKTSNVTNMQAMFYGCSSLTTLDLSNFNTAKVTNMAFMFRGCSKLKVLDLSGFETPSVEEMNVMFYACQALTTIFASNSWNTGKVAKSAIMFGQCTSLVGGAGTRYDEDYVDHTYARLDGGIAAPGYFTYKQASKKGDVNGDGSVDVADIATIISVMAGSSVNADRADVNNDGTVDVADIATVISVMAANARLQKLLEEAGMELPQ